MTLFTVAPGSAAPGPKTEPVVPSHALVLVQFGVPHLLHHQGNAIDYWVDCCGRAEALESMVDSSEPDGVFVWSGDVRNSQDYWGEWDTELETKELRLVTVEEWKAFVANEIVWDVEEWKAWLNWRGGR